MSTPVQSRDKCDCVPVLNLVGPSALQFPVRVVDHDDDTRPHTVALHKHLFLLLHVALAKMFDKLRDSESRLWDVEREALLVAEKQLKAAGKFDFNLHFLLIC